MDHVLSIFEKQPSKKGSAAHFRAGIPARRETGAGELAFRWTARFAAEMPAADAHEAGRQTQGVHGSRQPTKRFNPDLRSLPDRERAQDFVSTKEKGMENEEFQRTARLAAESAARTR